MPPDLGGRVAVVAGATRGAGRAISVELGAAGAIVYVTGRSTRAEASEMGRPETIEETAELVDAAGGSGIAIRVDHTQPAEVAERVRAEQDGRLDLLVNDVWGGDLLTEWVPFWEHSLENGLRMQELAVHTHLITSWHLARLMVERGGGLIVEVTDGVAALAITPGFLRSEAVLDHFEVDAENWRDAIARDRHFAASETPHFVGRAIAALAADPDVPVRSGGVFTSWDLAKEYDFDDVDGARPDWGAHFREHVAGSG